MSKSSASSSMSSSNGAHSLSRSDSMSSSEGHGYGGFGRRYGGKKTPKRHHRKRPTYAGEKPKSGSRKVKPTVDSNADVKVVKAINSAELDDMSWGKTSYLFKVESSLNDMREKAGYDSAGNQRPLVIFLGEGVRVEGTTEDIHKRIESNRGLDNATHEHMKKGAAADFSDHRDVVRRVTVTGHNKFPGTVEVCLDNIQGSADNVQFSSATKGPTQSLVLRAEAGEKFENRTVLRNALSEQDIHHLQYYSNATANSLDDGVMPALARNGVPQVLVPSSDEKPHIVIDDICRHYKDDVRCTDKQRRYIEKKKEIPPDIIYISEDNPGCVIVSKELFEDYKQRCVSSLKKTRPLSDVSNPHGYFTRVIADKHFKSGQAMIKSSSAMDDDGSRLWDHPEGTQVGLVSAEAKKKVFDKIHCAWFRVNVHHAPIDQITAESSDED